MTTVGVPPSVVATSVLADTLPNPSPTDGNVLHFLCETRFTISCGSIIGSSKSVSATMLGPPVEIDILDEGGDHAAMKPPNGTVSELLLWLTISINLQIPVLTSFGY